MDESNKTPVKLAICGQLRAGKSSVSSILVGSYGFRKVAFGDALKRQAHEAFPWIPRKPKPRALYQAYGTAMRELPVDGAEDVWVEHAMRTVDFELGLARMDERPARIVLDDLRQPNEFSRLKSEGFTLIRVTAPLELRKERAREAGDVFTDADLAHDTERHASTFEVDYEVVNDGDFGDLKTKVDDIMAELGVSEDEVAWL